MARLTAELAAYFAEHGSDEVTRARFAYRNWSITPDLEPDAPSTRHKFRCLGEDGDGTSCGAESHDHAAFEDARSWTFQHVREYPEHTIYEQVLCRPWLMRPGKFL
ncbi:hypothetical protein I5Q34_20360 [Streptomyces sp. AV19]|uniref:DUF7848 domain-containing protein n=1 Tax=Streptomyces sp. AV19 TaxID=2793068 RepID=UPI0018FE7AF1|nr:hypothetical protein [Streptomyces sp. AV19]MBH1936601.1 hypothetical protein [Streptomyces sp. AV19]MDG4532661.1 hypothetical protein [Streptomyces sp. AV19]